MAAVDHSRSLLKLIPYGFADLFCHRAYGTPLVVKALKHSECHHRIGHGLKLLSLLDERAFRLEIPAKVEVAQLLVDLQIVVEAFNHVLELFPDLGLGCRRHLFYLLEIRLKFLEVGEFCIDIVNVASNFLHTCQDLLFLFKISGASCLFGCQIIGTALLEICV